MPSLKDRLDMLEQELRSRRTGRTDYSLVLLPLNVKQQIMPLMPDDGEVAVSQLPCRPELKEVLDEWATKSPSMLNRISEHLGQAAKDRQWFSINEHDFPDDVKGIIHEWEKRASQFDDREDLIEWLEQNHDRLNAKVGLLTVGKLSMSLWTMLVMLKDRTKAHRVIDQVHHLKQKYGDA